MNILYYIFKNNGWNVQVIINISDYKGYQEYIIQNTHKLLGCTIDMTKKIIDISKVVSFQSLSFRMNGVQIRSFFYSLLKIKPDIIDVDIINMTRMNTTIMKQILQLQEIAE